MHMTVPPGVGGEGPVFLERHTSCGREDPLGETDGATATTFEQAAVGRARRGLGESRGREAAQGCL